MTFEEGRVVDERRVPQGEKEKAETPRELPEGVLSLAEILVERSGDSSE